MKNHLSISSLVMVLMLTACTALATAEPATPTPEIFIARTQAIPAEVMLSGVRLQVIEAVLDDHFPAGCHGTEPLCTTAPSGFLILSVTLAPVASTSTDMLDYKQLPDGIRVNDERGNQWQYGQRTLYAAETQHLTLGFEVSDESKVFGLQWPEAAEIPLSPQQLR